MELIQAMLCIPDKVAEDMMKQTQVQKSKQTKAGPTPQPDAPPVTDKIRRTWFSDPS